MNLHEKSIDKNKTAHKVNKKSLHSPQMKSVAWHKMTKILNKCVPSKKEKKLHSLREQDFMKEKKA